MQYDKRALRKNFSRASQHYDEHAVFQKTVLSRLAERLEFLAFKPGVILDLGSGTGNARQHLIQRYKSARLIELDMTLAMLQTSRQRRRLFKTGSMYVCGDQEFLPLADESADMVFSSLSLQWSTDFEAVFKEASRVLVSGGLFIFSTLGTSSLHELRQSWASVDTQTHVNDFHDIRKLGDALLNHRFVEPVLDNESIILAYDKAMDVLKDLKALGVNNVVKDRHQGLMGKSKLEKFSSEYEKLREAGRLPLSYEVIYAHAWKGPSLPIDNAVPQEEKTITFHGRKA